MEVSEVCITPLSPSSPTQTHTQSPSGGLESFNHGRHPTSPPASPLTTQTQRDVGQALMLTCTLFNKCIKHTHAQVLITLFVTPSLA